MSVDAVALPALSLLKRELVRFFRQPNRVVGAIGQPLMFWLLLGSGLSSLRGDYLQYFFPGTIVLVVLFTSIFSSMSTIEDRREGFLQGVLVAPIPRSALVLGKVLGGTVLATIQGVLLLALAPLIGIPLGPGQALAAAAVLFLCSFGLTALGFAVAWRMDSTQGFHAFMGLFLFPMWLLSGAFFPAEGTPAILRAVMAVNPLTYAVAALQRVMSVPGARLAELPPLWLSLLVTVAFCAAGFAASAALTRRRETEALHP